jgi:hypothetical protein
VNGTLLYVVNILPHIRFHWNTKNLNPKLRKTWNGRNEPREFSWGHKNSAEWENSLNSGFLNEIYSVLFLKRGSVLSLCMCMCFHVSHFIPYVYGTVERGMLTMWMYARKVILASLKLVKKWLSKMCWKYAIAFIMAMLLIYVIPVDQGENYGKCKRTRYHTSFSII